MRSSLTLLASALAIVLSAPLTSAAPIAGVDYASVVERSEGSVVYVEVHKAAEKKADKPGDPAEAVGQGSGFIFDAAHGYVLTNAHVVAGAKEVTLTLADRRRVKAKVVGQDERTDIAVLQVEAAGLKAVRIGDVAKLRVGDPVMAVGAPFGLEMTVTAGIVSAKNRTLAAQFVPFLQTDAAVNPGNSGGPLFNAKGEVVGITSQIYSKSGAFAGLSFAIPADLAVRVAQDIIAHGKVVRSKIGVSLQPVSEEVAQAFGLPRGQGALIAYVDAKGPGKAAGLREGDIVLAADGHVIEDSLDLPRYVTSVKPDSQVSLSVWRDGKRIELTSRVVVLDESPAAANLAKPAEQQLGLVARVLTADEREQLELTQGLMVDAVRKGSSAESAGLKAGDVLLTVRQASLTSVSQLRELLGKEKGKLPVLVLRGGGRSFLVLDVTPPAPAE